jgi:hypothetical protein
MNNDADEQCAWVYDTLEPDTREQQMRHSKVLSDLSGAIAGSSVGGLLLYSCGFSIAYSCAWAFLGWACSFFVLRYLFRNAA